MLPRRTRSLTNLACVIAGYLAWVELQFACGPFPLRTIFTYRTRPTIPLEEFVQGKFGVLQPKLSTTYLFVAYRHLSGIGLSDEEKQGMLRFWRKGLPKEPAQPGHWRKARSKVPGLPKIPKIEVYRRLPESYSYYLNCPGAAFRTAAETLAERIRAFGIESREVREWALAQDQVFENCASGPSIPEPAPPDLPAVIRADRDYQIAAAHFYAGDFDQAKARFQAISADDRSPWRTWAPYLVARALTRQGTLAPGAYTFDDEALAQAEERLTAVVNDSKLSSTHSAARGLLGFLRFRRDPEGRFQELTKALSRAGGSSNFGQDLYDYLRLVRRGYGKEAPSDMAGWLRNFRGDCRSCVDEAIEKWERTSSTPWLVSALARLPADDPRACDLIQRGRATDVNSPGYASISYHATRLLLESGARDEARAELDRLLALEPIHSDISSLNLFLSLRMRLAQDLDEFLKYAQRVPVAMGWSMESGENLSDWRGALREDADGRPFLGDDAVAVLYQKMPLELLAESASKPVLAPHLRRRVALSAWSRAALIGRQELGNTLVPTLAKLAPLLDSHLAEYAAAGTDEARAFAAAVLMLKFPGILPYVRSGVGRKTPLGEIDNFRKNWWCQLGPGQPLIAYTDLWSAGPERPAPEFPPFLTEQQKQAARSEAEILFKIPTGPNYLGEQVVKWARNNRDDPRVPEALHRVVKSTRFGCTDPETGGYSQQAFRLLHRRYPDSEWAKKTKYWYR